MKNTRRKIVRIATLALATVAHTSHGTPPPAIAAKGMEALYGKETVLCLERGHAAVAEGLRNLDSLLRKPLAEGKNIREEWAVLANSVCQDVELYCRAAVDAAKDARKANSARATDAQMDTLASISHSTIESTLWVFRIKGQEVAQAWERAAHSAAALAALRNALPAIGTQLRAELALASDTAFAARRDVQAGALTDGLLDTHLQRLGLARRSAMAVKRVGGIQRAKLPELLRPMETGAMLAVFRKATDQWIPADEGENALITRELRQLMQKWTPDMENTINGSYASLYKQASAEAEPYADGSFVQVGLFKNIRFEDIDKALDPYIDECKTARTALRDAEQSQRDIEHADKAADDEIATANRDANQSGTQTRQLVERMKTLQIQRLYEADRRKYQDVTRRFNATQAEETRLKDTLQRIGRELLALRQTKIPAGPVTDRTRAAIHDRLARTKALHADLIKTSRELRNVMAEVEELLDESQELRARMRGDGQADH